MKVFVAGSIEEHIEEKYLKEAKKYAEFLANKEYDLIFGAKNSGILKIVYETFRQKDRYIKAITIDRYKDDLKKVSADEEIVSANVHKQYKRFLEADLMLFMPGGCGTLSEFSFMLNAKRNNEVRCPLYLVNIDGYYDGIIRQIKTLGSSKVLLVSNRGSVMTETVELKGLNIIAKLEKIEIQL